MMRTTTSLFILLILFFFNELKSQLNFTLVPQACQNQSLSLSASSGTLAPMGYTWTSIPTGAVFSSANSSLSTLSFTASGTYTISLLVSSNSGTTASSKTISVIPFPISALTPQSQTICPGQSATLIASGANSYTWFPTSMLVSLFGASVVASPSVSMVYSVTGTSSLCGTSHLNFNVSVNVYPNVSWAASAFSVCEGQTTNLSAFGAISFTWLGTSFSVAITQPSISVGAGSYTLIGSNGGSCSVTLQQAIVITSVNCTGFEETENDLIDFKLFPNPVLDKLYLSNTNNISSSIEICDVFGKILFSQSDVFATTNTQEIDVHDFPVGIYFIRLKSTAGSNQIVKFIKE